VTAAGDLPRFSMAISAGQPGAGGVALGSPDLGASPVSHDDDAGKVLAEGSVDTPARVVRRVTPSYPASARAEGVEAPVALELVVSASGSVEDVRIERAAGHGLDEAAARAVRQFVFSPAIKRGHPVRVRMSWVVDFRLD
jgi:protein TonB